MTTYTIPHSAAKALLRGATVELAPGVMVRAEPPVLTAATADTLDLLPDDTIRIEAAAPGWSFSDTPTIAPDAPGDLVLHHDPDAAATPYYGGSASLRAPDRGPRLLGSPTPLRYGEAEVSTGHGTLTVRVPLGHPVHLAVEECGLGHLFRIHPPGWPEVVAFASRVNVSRDRASITFTEYPAAYDPIGSLAERLSAVPHTLLSLVP